MASQRQGRVVKLYRVSGPRAGKDCVLGAHRFIAGELEISLTQKEHESLARYLWYYQVEEVKDDGKRDVLPDGDGDMEGEVRPEGQGASAGGASAGDPGGTTTAGDVGQGRRLVPGGDGQAEGVGTLRRVLLTLDVSNDANWTPTGKPAVAAVTAALGRQVTRAQIDAAIPGYSRKGMA
jgi:hypothetical protein